jgi:hypothetical protein
VPGFERVDTLATHAGGSGQLVGAHVPLLAHPPNCPPEDGQIRVSMSAIGQEKLANWDEDDCLHIVSTDMP